MPLKVWNGSSWQVVAQLKIWNGSSWVSTNALDNAKSARVWNGSSWVQFHPGVRLDEYGGTDIISLYHSYPLAVSSDYAEVGITLNSGGSASYWYEDSITARTDFLALPYNWLLTGANSDYYAFMDTPSSGSFSSGTTNSALQLNTTRTWGKRQTGGGFTLVQSTLRIQNAAGTDILSISVDLSAEVTP